MAAPAVQVFDVLDEQPSLVFALILAGFEATAALVDDVASPVFWVFLEAHSVFERVHLVSAQRQHHLGRLGLHFP